MVIGLFVIIGLGSAVGLGAMAVTRYRLAKLIADTPTTPISDLTNGFVEVKGKVSALSEALISPMTKSNCVYYRFHVQERIQQGKSSKWVTRIDESDHKLCLLEDGSGAVELDLITADLRLQPDTSDNSGFLNSMSPEMEELLNEYGFSSTSLVFNKTLKIEETVLEIGDEVYALGECVLRDNEFPEITQGANGIYLVSDHSEDALIQKINGSAVMYGLGAGALGIGGIVAAWFFATL